ncbi:MAG: DUF4097 domain-containing protein [Treponema sp.]|jgi:DUF4097 and DUF4098 domain-containing protein YvlB|nr:DUF4097 domain-containing protein [Treponema sp.]
MQDFLRINRQTAPVHGIDNLYIRYRSDTIMLLKTDGDDLVVEEHLLWDMEECDAEMSVSGRDLTITGGSRPSSSNGSCLIKLYLPASYRNNMSVSDSSGSIVSETDLESAGWIDLKVSSGSIKLTSISAESIKVDMSSGSIAVNKITGRSVISSASGMITIGEIYGQDHEIKSSSGSTEIKNSYSDNLKIQCQSGQVTIRSAVGTVEASCMSGLLRINDMNGSGVFSSQCGGIVLSISGTKGNYKLNSNVGNITLSIPQDASYTLNAKSMMSSIKRSSGNAPELVINAKTMVGTIILL